MPLTKPKLVLFDVDETLAVVRKWEKTVVEYCRQKNIDVPPKLLAWFKKDRDIDDTGRVIRMSRDSYGDDFDVLKDQLPADFAHLATFDQDISKIHDHMPRYIPYEGSQEFVQKLRDEGVKIGFVTTSDRASIAAEMQALGFFDPASGDILLGRNDFSQHDGKIDGIEKALKHFGMKPDKDVWIVGDAEMDIKSGLRLGLSAVAYGDRTLAARYATSIRDQSGFTYWDSLDRDNPQKHVKVDRNQIETAVTFRQMSALFENSRSAATGLSQ